MNLFDKILLSPNPILRRSIVKFFYKKFSSVNFLIKLGVYERNYYIYCIYWAAYQAKQLGLKSISVLEFGVGHGTGLLLIEKYSKKISKLFDINIHVYGFDTGTGLPPTKDYRDMPFLWKEGLFEMDINKLQTSLSGTKLVLGDVKDTVTTFFKKYSPPPIGAIIIDLDYYSSTKDAFNILLKETDYYLPRLYCYFDDIIGTEFMECSEYTGERLAINEFNEKYSDKKIEKAYHLISKGGYVVPWHHQIRIIHFFKHKQYNTFLRYLHK